MTHTVSKHPFKLIIEMTPTDGLVPWPAELDGLDPDFCELDTLIGGRYYGDQEESEVTAPNKTFLYPWRVDLLRGIVSFHTRADFSVVQYEGDLLLLMHPQSRMYMVTVNPYGQFDADYPAPIPADEKIHAVFTFVRPADC